MSNKIRRLIHISLTAAASGLCLLLSTPCAVITGIFSLIIFIYYECIFSKRKAKLLKMCDDIDRILRNDDIISFDEYKEGEMSVLSAEIHKMTLRLREQNTALLNEKVFAKEALEDISHQLRTPLTSVMMILGLMQSPDLTEKNRMEYIRELYELLSRMKWLIETMLSLSRIEAEAVTFTKNDISCYELIRKSVETVSVTAELKNVEIKIVIEGEPMVRVDLHYTSEAIVNLLKNAIEHTPSGGTITVTAKGNNVSANIIIEDTGDGIPEKELPHIFERFYRSSEYTKKGYGIGLAFAKKVITEQNGSLKASNRKPSGALFDIKFYKVAI